MNILVTGANGQLGNEMRIVAKNTSDNYIFTDVNEVEGFETTFLDITDIEAIRKMVKEYEVNAIVNCAAWTNVDACETDEKLAALAEKLNADAPENLAKVMKEVDMDQLGISLRQVNEEEKKLMEIDYGLTVNAIRKGKMQQNGVSKGTIILSANDKKLKTLEDWEEAVKSANQSSDRTLWIKALSPSGRKIAFAIELDEK